MTCHRICGSGHFSIQKHIKKSLRVKNIAYFIAIYGTVCRKNGSEKMDYLLRKELIKTILNDLLTKI